MKFCNRCNRWLPLDCFPIDSRYKDGHSSWCKECKSEYNKMYMKTYDKEHRKPRTPEEIRRHNVRSRDKANTFLDSLKTQCAKCGIVDKYVLTFHHIDYNDKSFNISSGVGIAKDKLINEVKKCKCLCWNCHYTYHYFYGKQPNNPKETLNDFLQVDWKPSESLRDEWLLK